MVEKVEGNLPGAFLLGTGQSRDEILGDVKSCQRLGATTVVWDANDFPMADPCPTPIHLSKPTEWFVYHLALVRGKIPSIRRYVESVLSYPGVWSPPNRFLA